jgi:RecB family exonuclease
MATLMGGIAPVGHRCSGVRSLVGGHDGGAVMTGVLDLNLMGLAVRDLFSFCSRPKLVPINAPAQKAVEAAAVAASGVEAVENIASVLSPSQVRTFTDCQTRWMYRYVLDQPETRSSALGLGTAFHEAIGQNFREKIGTKKDLPAEAVVGMFHASWAAQAETLTFTDDEDPQEIEDCGAAMVEAYMQNVAPLIQPAAVEVPVSGELGGARVKGKIDVLTTDGTIIDSKTASKKPSSVAADYRFQVSTYVQLHSDASGSARLDTVTKTRTIAVHQTTLQIGEADRAQTAKMYPLVQEAMRSGLYVPNRASFLCSRKYCPHWQRCEDEYGGKVDDK